MPLPVKITNPSFNDFVKFATDNIAAGNKKAIANIEQTPLGKRNIVASSTDSVGGIFSRTQFEMGANDATRSIFLNAVTKMFGGRSKIPESVWNAINLQDYGHGQPLTARRIMAVKAAVDAHLSAPPDKLDVEVCGKTVTFEKWHYERMVAAMPENERPRGLAGREQLANTLRTMLSDRIGKGLKILQDVRAGFGSLHPASAKNVADLTLALHAIALSNGDKLQNGSFSVADPDGSLARWLDTSDELYLRESSHLKAYQKMTVDGHRNILRGIDVPEGKTGLLAGMRTVHYGTIPDLTKPDGNGPKRRLFLKCESHGCFHNPISKADQAAGMTPNMRQRQAKDGDWSESILHGLSFLETRGADPTAGGARKEHMTAGMKTAIQRAVDELKAGGRADLAETLTSRNVEKGGSMLLFDNLFKAIDAEPENALLQKVVNDLVAAAKADIGDKHGDAGVRLGNEVMIDVADLSAFAPPAMPLQIKGAGAQKIADVLLNKSDIKDAHDAASTFKARMNAIAKAEITSHIADQIGVKLRATDKNGTPFINLEKLDTEFDKDIMRDTGWTINGQAVPKDPKAARDMLARFITGDENATFAGADAALKTKVHVLMGCLHQGVSACATEGVGFAFTPTTGQFARLNANVHPDGGTKTQSFALTKDADGNILIDHKVHFVGGVLLQINDGENFEHKKTDKNGGVDYGVKITVPKADLDRFANVDWTQYDSKPVNVAVRDTTLPNRFSTAENLVPEQFRFTGTVDVTCEIRANSLHGLEEAL